MLFGGNGVIYTASEDTTIGTFGKNGHKLADLKGHGHWVNSIALNVDFVQRTACFSEDAIKNNVPLKERDQMVKVAKERY
jgi:ribosome assembly protein 4